MISLIVAYSKNNKVIGINNTIPWHIKEDFILESIEEKEEFVIKIYRRK